MNIKKSITYIYLSTLLLFSCGSSNKSENESTKREFGIFKVLDDNITIEMNGEVKSTSLDNFNQLEAFFPNIKTINIILCDGSSDDEINLQLSLKVHQKGINTHLMDDGIIASGGTDFFLAGVKRTIGTNTKIGVHSWAGDDGNAKDFPRGHSNHLPYINYYVAVGFNQQQAEDFYYYTINAAIPESMHWMTATEIETYNLIRE